MFRRSETVDLGINLLMSLVDQARSASRVSPCAGSAGGEFKCREIVDLNWDIGMRFFSSAEMKESSFTWFVC